MMELKRRHMNALRALAENPDKIWRDWEIPDGNGRSGAASGLTLRDLRHAGLAEQGGMPWHQVYGHRITEDGLKIIKGESA